MPASSLVTRRRLLVALVVLVLAVAAVVAAVALRPDTDPAADGTQSAGPTSGEGSEQEAEPDAGEPRSGDPETSAPAGDTPDAGSDEGAAPEARETLDPAPFGAEATPEPGVTVTVPSVEKVTGEANVPGEVGGPALRFTVELTNGTGEVLDLRTVVVNAYYGPDRTPATPMLEPGGRPFEPEVAADESAHGAFVFSVPPELQDQVELEIDAGVGKAIVIFAGA
jgi:hypothetical protein